jgi:hypothetical protein
MVTFPSVRRLYETGRFRTEPAGLRKKNWFRTEPVMSDLNHQFEPVFPMTRSDRSVLPVLVNYGSTACMWHNDQPTQNQAHLSIIQGL